jgi:hypothetical protein
MVVTDTKKMQFQASCVLCVYHYKCSTTDGQQELNYIDSNYCHCYFRRIFNSLCGNNELSVKSTILTPQVFGSCPLGLFKEGSKIFHWVTWEMIQGSNISSSEIMYFKLLNLLKTKRRLLYLKTQSVPRCKHFSSRLKKQDKKSEIQTKTRQQY